VVTVKIRGSDGGDCEDEVLTVVTVKIRGSDGGDCEDMRF